MATKLEGVGALVAGPLWKKNFFAASLGEGGSIEQNMLKKQEKCVKVREGSG